MKYIILSIIALTVIIVLFACKTRKKTPNMTNNLSEQGPIISFSKGSCRGTCKTFNLTISNNKTIDFVGIKNVEHIGNFQGQLSEEQYKNLLDAFNNNGFSQLKDDYMLAVRDLQKIEIAYQGKNIKFHKRNVPDSLLGLMNKLDELIGQIDLVKM